MSEAHEPRERKRSIAHRVDALLEKLERKALESGRKRIRVPFYLARLLIQVVRQWVRDRCPQQAASLAFQTVLSIVPLLAVATATLRALGYFEAESSLVNFIADNLMPVSRQEISEQLADYSKNITFESVGLLGLAVSLILAFVMFNNLERIMNYVWRAERNRSITQKFIVFYASLTVVPVLVGVSLVEAARWGLTSGIAGMFLGFGASFAALFLANIFLPVPKVKLVPAAIGALLTAVLFEISKLGFSAYVANYALAKYSGIYGAMAIIPLWLVWIYYSWLILLLGVEVAHAVQNLKVLENMDRRTQMSLATELLRRVNGVVASRIMVAVAESFARGKKVLSKQAVCDRFDLSEEVTSRLVERLIDHDMLMEVEGELSGLAPARPPAQIRLGDVLKAFRGEDIDFDFDRPGRELSPLDVVLREIEESTREKTMSVTLAELVVLDDSEKLEEQPAALADQVEPVADHQDSDGPGDP